MTKLIESCIDFSLLGWLSWSNPVTLQHYNFVSVGILERILHEEITFWITWFPDDRMFFIQFMETRQYFVFYCTLFCCMVFHCIVCNGNPLFLVQSVTLLYPISLCNYYIAMVFYCIVFFENALLFVLQYAIQWITRYFFNMIYFIAFQSISLNFI